jgi:thiol-disulfide isomerase/thioredoxin
MAQLTLLVALAALGCQRGALPAAPSFELTDLDGRAVRSADLAGKVVLIDLWASWCKPCVRGLPALLETEHRLAGKLAIVGVALDNVDTGAHDPEGMLRAFAAAHQIDFPIVELTPQLNADYGRVLGIGKIARDDHMVAANLPSWIVIDRAGAIRAIHASASEEPQMLAELAALAAD